MRAILHLLFLLTSATAFEHFEARHCHPIDFTPDGKFLLAVNASEGRLSVFSSAFGIDPPRLIAEIPVGLEPVTVRARSNDEAWIVNEVSDTIAIVDLHALRTVATLPAGDEPADVVFVQGLAYVTSARENRILVFDVATRTRVAEIPLEGNFPRTLAVSPDGTRLFAGFLYAGNKTTTLHFRDAPAQPAPSNPNLPPPPQVALIVPDSDPRIPYEVIDHDIAEIDTATGEVLRYHASVGTNIHALSCAPDGTLWAAATEARNLIRFEPNLNGIFQESRIARVSGNTVTIHDLNPHATTPHLPPAGRDLTLAQPMAIVADDSGAWVAASGSDRLARLDVTGAVLHRIDLRPTFPNTVRGPRGIAIHPLTGRIAVLNKLSNTISIVSPTTLDVRAEFPLASHHPIPVAHQQGRGFFHDSRRSGNGTVSCASCHFDADIDGVAWDLGDPGGEMITKMGISLSLHEFDPVERPMHPMKGPMVTQPLRGIKDAGPFHWRGDRDTIHEFNSSFSMLQAGEELAPDEMDKVVAYIESLRNHPNPFRLLDNSLPATLNGANLARGRLHFHDANVCSSCHDGPRGTNHVLDEFSSVLTRQPVKNSTLEHVYKKLHYTPGQSSTLSGFGFNHDGTGHNIPRGHEYAMDLFAETTGAEADVMAFILCTETDTKPAVGRISSTPSDSLHARAAAGDCDVVAHAVIDGISRSYLYHPTSGHYLPPSTDLPPLHPDDLAAGATSLLIFTVPPGNGARFSIDRSGDGILNEDTPRPSLHISPALDPVYQPERADWFIESSENLRDWRLYTPTHEEKPPRQFFRLRRSW